MTVSVHFLAISFMSFGAILGLFIGIYLAGAKGAAMAEHENLVRRILPKMESHLDLLRMAGKDENYLHLAEWVADARIALSKTEAGAK